MTFDRQYVERRGSVGAGIVDQTDDWWQARVLGNIPLWCRKDDLSVTPCIINEGFWEAWITAWVLNNIDEDTTFVDVGANTGYYSVIAAHYGAEAIALEPNPKYTAMLRQYPNITTIETAVSDKFGTAALNVPSGLQGSASLSEIPAKWDISTIHVATDTLDNLVEPHRDKVLIKIDTEGAEEKVWDGMQSILGTYLPSVILEYTPGSYSDKFLEKMEEYAPLAWINHAGEKEFVSRDWMLAQNDWAMLCLEP